MTHALLVLEDGTVFAGESLGATGETVGELIVTTAMTGYQELLTSGAYEGAVVLFTTPHVGNVGMNSEDGQGPLCAGGVVLREQPRLHSNWRAQRSFEDDLLEAGTVGITGVDTRALTRRARSGMRVGIFTGEVGPLSELVQAVRATPAGADTLISRATTAEPYRVGEGEPAVAIIDLGLGRELAETVRSHGTSSLVLPASATYADVVASGADRVLLSGGPGNPADATTALGLARELVSAGLPVLGFGLGHQILARALGFATEPLTRGHHGANHPVQASGSGHVDITSHTHSYTVDFAGSPDVDITHVSLNDGSVEGFAVRGKPVAGLQFHPELGTGPSDAHHLLDSFLKDA